MPPGTLAVSYVPGYHVPLNQTEGRRQIHLVSRETAVLGLRSFRSFPLGWSSLQSAERIENFELQTTVIAKKFTPTGNPEDNRGIVVATLNSGTRTSRAPHIAGHLNQFAAPRKQQFVGFGELDGNPRINVEIPEQKHESPPNICPAGLRLNNPGDFLLSHTVSRAVPSAPAGLTSVFGMGTGVTLPTKSPENFFGSGGSSLVALRSKSKKLSPPLRSGYCPASATACQKLRVRATELFEISDLRSEISESNSDQGKSDTLTITNSRFQIANRKLTI